MTADRDRADRQTRSQSDVSEIERLKRHNANIQEQRVRLAALLFPSKNPVFISWDDLAMGLTEHVAESDHEELVRYVEGVVREEGVSVPVAATTKALVEALQDELRAQRERADDAEKERDAAQAKIEEQHSDAVELLKALDFDVMPLLPVGSGQDAPSFDDPLVIYRLRAQRAS